MAAARKQHEKEAISLHSKLLHNGFKLPKSALRQAIRSNSAYAYLRVLLNKGLISVNSVDKKGDCLLCFICEKYDYDNFSKCVRLLCEKGADVHFVSKSGDTAASTLLIRAKGSDKISPFLEVMPVLIEHGLDVNYEGPEKVNTMWCAIATYGRYLRWLFKIIKLLVDNKFDINKRFRETMLPLPFQAKRAPKLHGNPYVELVNYVICKISRSEMRVLYDITCYLLEKDLDVNCTDSFDCNALMILASEPSCYWATLATATALIKKGINVNQRNVYGINALNLICLQGNYSPEGLLNFTKLLLEYGIDVNNPILPGRTNLHALLRRSDRLSPHVWSVILLMLERSTEIAFDVKETLWSLYLSGELTPEQLYQPAFRNFLLRRIEECSHVPSLIHATQFMTYGVPLKDTWEASLRHQMSRALKSQERRRR